MTIEETIEELRQAGERIGFDAQVGQFNKKGQFCRFPVWAGVSTVPVGLDDKLFCGHPSQPHRQVALLPTMSRT